MRTLLDGCGIADPTAGKPAGQFSDPAVQKAYDRLLAQGQASQAAALQAAGVVERHAIDALWAALKVTLLPLMHHLDQPPYGR